MPAFSSKLSDTEVRNLVAYLRSFVPGPTRPVQQTADDFEQRYRQLQDQLNELKRQYRALSPRD